MVFAQEQKQSNRKHWQHLTLELQN